MASLRFPDFARLIPLALAIVLAMSLPAVAEEPDEIRGVVHDPTGAVIAEAEIRLVADGARIVSSAQTDAEGRFTLVIRERGSYILEVRAAGFSPSKTAIEAPVAAGRTLTLVTGDPALAEQVSVTAVAGRIEPATRVTQPINVIGSDQIQLRAKSVIVQAANEEVGLHLQQTSPVMAGVFVRGLTGNKVNVFVDGVRYSTGSQRGGVSTFIDLLDPALVESIEVLRGPNSAQYGSDALGGSLQFLSRVPPIGMSGGKAWSGMFSGAFNSADRGVGSNLTASYAGSRFGLLAGVAARRIGELRAGGGIDSHAAITRFLGLRSDVLMPSRLSGTGFSQYGGNVTLNWLPGTNDHLVASYRHGSQDGGKRYDQLLGGDGNLVADLRGLSLDLLLARYERIDAGWFDHVTVTASVNSQFEERINQGGNGNPRATITHEPERTTAYGLSGKAQRRLTSWSSVVVGGDFYPESVTSPSTGVNPVTGAEAVRRGRVPDGATYRSGGLFAQAIIDAIPSKVQVVGNVRVNRASYRARAPDSPRVNGQPLWPDDSLTATGSAFRVGMSAAATEQWTFTANVSRGFRAPHITDLGTLGLTGSGFEVAAPDVAGLGATVGTTADASAKSTGLPVAQVVPETSLTYEAGVQFRARRFRTGVSLFANNIHDNITKQTLILPAGAIGTLLGGTPIVAQNANGAVFVAAATNPVLVRANYDNARVAGVEHTAEWRVTDAWSVGTSATYLYAKDTRTGLPPNIEGGTPAPEAYVRINYRAPGGRWWAGTYAHLAASQDRLSSLDLDDRRTGAGRSRTNIRNFFLNGATARGWIGPGADNVTGTADDILLATGETLAQVQDRVLGPGVNSAPMLRQVAGYITLGLRGGIRVGPHDITVDVENLTDRNYRGVSWGVDAPGRAVAVRYTARF